MKKHYIFTFLFSVFLSLNLLLSMMLSSNDGKARLNLLFVGDIMGHGPQIRSAELVKNERYDYLPCFKYVRPILDQADLAIGNLELTLPGKPPYQGYPQFRSPTNWPMP